MTWPPVEALAPEPLGDARKDGCGGMLSARFVREAVAFWRVATTGRSWLLGVGVPEREERGARRRRQQLATGRRTSCTSIIFFCLACFTTGEIDRGRAAIGSRCGVMKKSHWRK